MSQPLSEYFALEAAEFLDQMDALLAGSERPDALRFFRLARGVRGSAQLAGATAIAGLAERLEDGARALRDGQLAWSPEVRDRARATATDLRELVGRHEAGWSAADDERARAAALRWSDVGTSGRPGAAPAGGDELFGFVRREITGVVAEMDRMLDELRLSPEAREPLRGVLRRMRPVRGVAGMDVLAPVLEVLEGIEDAAHEILGRSSAVNGGEMDLLRAARQALHAAGITVEGGQAPGQSPELTAFRELRSRVEEAAPGQEAEAVIPIGRLFGDAAGPHVVSSTLAPLPGEGGALTPEVEHFLRIEGTGFLDRAQGLLAGVPSNPRRFRRVARDVAELAASVRELATTYGVASMAAAAELAATRVSAAATPDDARDALDALRHALPGAPPAPAAAPSTPAASTATLADGDTGAPPPEASALAADDGVVPVEALLYAPGDALREALGLRERLVQLAGQGPGTPLGEVIDELFGLVELARERVP